MRTCTVWNEVDNVRTDFLQRDQGIHLRINAANPRKQTLEAIFDTTDIATFNGWREDDYFFLFFVKTFIFMRTTKFI
jgi:hypothetical protein